MTPAWAQRQAELLSDCIVSPDVFASMVDRLGDFVVPYQHAGGVSIELITFTLLSESQWLHEAHQLN